MPDRPDSRAARSSTGSGGVSRTRSRTPWRSASWVTRDRASGSSPAAPTSTRQGSRPVAVRAVAERRAARPSRVGRSERASYRPPTTRYRSGMRCAPRSAMQARLVGGPGLERVVGGQRHDRDPLRVHAQRAGPPRPRWPATRPGRGSRRRRPRRPRPVAEARRGGRGRSAPAAPTAPGRAASPRPAARSGSASRHPRCGTRRPPSPGRAGPDARLGAPQQERIERAGPGTAAVAPWAAASDGPRRAARPPPAPRVGSGRSRRRIDHQVLARQRVRRVAAQQGPEIGRRDGCALGLLEQPQVDDDSGACRADPAVGSARSARRAIRRRGRRAAPGAPSGHGRAARPSAAAARPAVPRR